MIANTSDNNITLNIKDLQQMQNALCKSLHVYIYCVSRNAQNLTSSSLSSAEEDYIDLIFPHQTRVELADSFIDGIPENIVERVGSEPYILNKAIAIRDDDNRILGAWLVVGVCEDLFETDLYLNSEVKKTNTADFEAAVELLEIYTKQYMASLRNTHNLEKSLDESHNVETEMEHRLLKSEVMTEILKMMESDNAFSKISEDILCEAGKYLNVTNCALFQTNTDGETVDMVCEWATDKRYELIEDFIGVKIESLPFMTGRPYTISSGSSIPDNFAKFFADSYIDAAVFLPLDIVGHSSMYLAVISCGMNRKWSVDDLKFINDVKRVIHTILIKRITKNSLASSYSALEAILEHTGCGVSVNDIASHTSLYTNQTFNEMFINPVDLDALSVVLYDKDETFPGISGYQAKQADRFYDLTFSMINWVDGRRVRLSTFYDTTDIRNYQRRIERQANEDFLTGLHNRKKCEKDIEEQISLASLHRAKFAMCFIDLDDFNNINDGLGHQQGDMLLKAIANALDAIPTISGHVYRVGGDEFVILVDYDNYNNLESIVKRVTALFDKTWNLANQEYYCTMSMSVVEVPKDGTNASTLFQKADIALREAKGKGKNRVVFYNTQEDNSSKRLDLEKHMRKAVADGCKEFMVYYQPLMNVGLEGSPCCGAEALVRWKSEELGFVMPSDFIPLSEYLGLIIPIGEHVLMEACTRCKHWNDFGHPEYKVNVNLSVIQLIQTDIVETVKKAIRLSEINPHNLTLEVTESLAINDIDKMKDVLQEIRALGCRVALDDFGTGYSSLNHIRSLPIDTIKIDQCFIKDIEDDEFSNSFVRTVSELADSLELDVCVEGVEKVHQKDMVNNYHVNLIQGYYFDKPLTAEEFEAKYVN